jgi:hypothetical protein
LDLTRGGSAYNRKGAEGAQNTVRSAGMMKGIIIVLLLLNAAPSVFAGEEEKIQVASIDKKHSFGVKKTFIPPIVTEKYEYYEIRGGSEQELRDQMSKSGSKWDDGKTYDSVTSWR